MGKEATEGGVSYVFNNPTINVVDSADAREPTPGEVAVALRRFVIRVASDGGATPAELDAMARVVEVSRKYPA